MAPWKIALLVLCAAYVVPIAAAATMHQFNAIGPDWWGADRSSAGLLPAPAEQDAAAVRVFAAPTVRWRGVFAVHSWIVIKPKGASSYVRYDYTAWGEPIRINGFEPDGRWFGRTPDVIFAADGAIAEAMIPRIQAAVEQFAWRAYGDYRAWPGPNSNTFVAAVFDSLPEAALGLPPTAIGKDYPYDGRWIRLTPSGTGVKLSAAGVFGIMIAWVEGIEINILGGVAGIDVRRPALKFPGLGRLGLAATSTP